MAQVKADKASYKNGWLVGFLVAAAVTIAFLAFVWEDADPFIEFLLVGLPIGIAAGVLAGLVAEGQAISREKRNIIGLLMLTGFAVYIVVLVTYLMSRTG